MGLFDKLERPAERAVSWSDQIDPGTWQPSDGRWFQPIGQWAQTFSGFPIGPDVAMRVSAVFACTSLLAEVVASLPCILYRRLDDGGKERARDHRLYKCLRVGRCSGAISRRWTISGRSRCTSGCAGRPSRRSSTTA